MTTEEFENKLHDRGYILKHNVNQIIIFNSRKSVVAEVRTDRFYALYTDYPAFTDGLVRYERQALIQVIDAYVKTPVTER